MENILLEDFLPLVTYSMAIAALIWLGRKAPDYVQLTFLTVVGCGISVYFIADVLGMVNGARRVWELRLYGSAYIFLGIMIYLVRQIWLKTDICRSLK